MKNSRMVPLEKSMKWAFSMKFTITVLNPSKLLDAVGVILAICFSFDGTNTHIVAGMTKSSWVYIFFVIANEDSYRLKLQLICFSVTVIRNSVLAYPSPTYPATALQPSKAKKLKANISAGLPFGLKCALMAGVSDEWYMFTLFPTYLNSKEYTLTQSFLVLQKMIALGTSSFLSIFLPFQCICHTCQVLKSY